MNLNRYFDHTLLKADATRAQIEQLCRETVDGNFYAVCVNSSYVSYVNSILENTNVKIACVIGFPLGASSTEVKVSETSYACSNGADEIDMVINVGSIKDGNWDDVYDDIKKVCDMASSFNSIVKVIIETCLLTDDEKIKACKVSKDAGAAFVKTSTGFSTGGATEEDIRLMRNTVGPDMGVKASGGIRDLKTAIKMIEAGADRIGASASVDIMNEYSKSPEF